MLFQAGGSALGLALAAKYADAVFIAASGAEVADSFASDLRAAADVVGRVILDSGEMEAGVVTAFIGGPALLLMVIQRMGVKGR